MPNLIKRELDFSKLVLLKGSHEPPKKPPPNDWELEMCIMEAVAFVAGETWTDSPQCASPTAGAFLRSLNDRMDDESRQKLKPYIVRLVGSRGTPEVEKRRAWMCADWLVRDELPFLLDMAKLSEEAKKLRDLPEIRDIPSLKASRSVRAQARKAAAECRAGNIARLKEAAWDAWVAWDAWDAWVAWAAGVAGDAWVAWAAGDAGDAGDAWAAGAAGDAGDAWDAGVAWVAGALASYKAPLAKVRSDSYDRALIFLDRLLSVQGV